MKKTRLLLTLAVIFSVGPDANGAIINLLESLSPGQFTRSLGISADGSAIIGYARNSNNQIFATRWRLGQPVDVLMPLTGDINSQGYAISNGGTVAVGISGPTISTRGVRWSQSGGVELVQTSSGATAVDVMDVSADGLAIVGRTPQDGFMIDATGTHVLPRISTSSPSYPWAISNDASTIVGWGVDGMGNRRAFSWNSGTGLQNLGTLPGFQHSHAIGISGDKSTVVGFLEQTSGSRSAFYWKSGSGMQLINPLSGYDQLVPGGVTADGNIIVGNSQAFGGNRAFIWTPNEGMRDLNNVFASILPSGWRLVDAYISDDGQILTGLISVGGPNLQAYVITIPEPTTGMLLVMTLGLLISHRIRIKGSYD